VPAGGGIWIEADEKITRFLALLGLWQYNTGMKKQKLFTLILIIIYFQLMLLPYLQGSEERYKILINTDPPQDNKIKPVFLFTFDPILQKEATVAKSQLEKSKPTQLSFIFKHPDLFRLVIPGKPPIHLIINKDQRLIQVEAFNGKPIKIKGSSDSEKLLAYEAFRKESNKRLIKPTYRAMAEASQRQDQEGEIAAVESYVRNSQLHRKELIDFTENEIGTSIALYGTSMRWTGDDEVKRLDVLVNAFAKKFPHLPMTKAMKDKVDRFRRVAIGAKATDIKGKTPNGQLISLHGSLGKYTLIDFWASWCRPCLLQFPDLKKAYEAFHEQGFEIFGYSIDTNRSKWIKAIKGYQMPWINISDLNGWQSPGATAYNVTFIPFNFLLNDKGEIIGKNLHHKTLFKKLKSLLKPSPQ
jgi:peroxiredoxin